MLRSAVTSSYSKASTAAAQTMGVSMLQPSRNMATLKEIQIRLKSVKNIAKITKSMKMIASTKLVRAQRAMDAARMYGNTSAAALKYMEPKPIEGANKKLLIACSSDRGLCGAIHSTVSKPIKAELRKNPEAASVVAIGDKAKSQVSRESRKSMAMSFNSIGKNIPTFAEASSVAELILGSKLDFGVASVYYNGFKSVISYELRIAQVFPESSITASDKLAQYELEDDVIQNFAEFTFANTIFHALVEGHASEMAARRSAMENATKNAGDMIDSLTMTYNRRRQAAITAELCDIITGASAL